MNLSTPRDYYDRYVGSMSVDEAARSFLEGGADLRQGICDYFDLMDEGSDMHPGSEDDTDEAVAQITKYIYQAVEFCHVCTAGRTDIVATCKVNHYLADDGNGQRTLRPTTDTTYMCDECVEVLREYDDDGVLSVEHI